MKKRDRIAKKREKAEISRDERSFYRWAQKRWPFVRVSDLKRLDAVKRYRLRYEVKITRIL